MLVPLLLTDHRGPRLTAAPSAWDGSTLPYAPSVSLKWSKPPTGTVLTSVDNLTTGQNVYCGSPATRTATDTSPLPGRTNTYRVTHTKAWPAVTASGKNLQVSGVNVGRFTGADASFLLLRGAFVGGTITGPPPVWMVDDAFRCVAAFGARVVRTYCLPVGQAGTLYPTLGGGLDATVAAGVDLVLARAAHWGIRLIVPFVDNNYGYYVGGINSFAGWGATGGVANFYTDATAKANFKAFISAALNRTNTLTGVKWGADPAVLAWQLGNELAAPTAWQTEMSNYVTGLFPAALVMSGAGVTAGYTGLDAGVAIGDRHLYASTNTAAQVTALTGSSGAGAAPLILAEQDWNNVQAGGDTLDQVLTAFEAAANGNGIMPWELRAHDPAGGWDSLGTADTGSGAYGLRWGDPGTLTKQARIRQCSDTLTGDTTPDLVPAAPLILSAGPSGVVFRGAAGAISYTFERSTTGPTSGFSTAQAGVTEGYGPTAWIDPSPPAVRAWYRVYGVSKAGVAGPTSAPVAVDG